MNGGIDLRFASTYHPQTKDMTEVTNQTILNGLKKWLDKAKRRWPEELTHVL